MKDLLAGILVAVVLSAGFGFFLLTLSEGDRRLAAKAVECEKSGGVYVPSYGDNKWSCVSAIYTEVGR